MKHMKLKQAVIVLAVALVAASPSFAQQQASDQCEQNPAYRDGLQKYVKGDFQGTLAAVQPLADDGDACGQWLLGQMYNFGQGVPKDHSKFVELVGKSAAQGYSKARGQAYAMGLNTN